MKKKIRLYLHNQHYESLQTQRRFDLLDGLVLVFKWLGKTLFNLCYGAGYFLLSLLLLPFTIFYSVKGVPDAIRSVKFRWPSPARKKSLIVFLVLLLISNLILHGSSVVASGQTLKSEVIEKSDTGLASLKAALMALQSSDYNKAQELFTQANNDFKKTSELLDESDIALKFALRIVPQGQDAAHVVEALRIITEIGLRGTQIYASMKELKIGPQGLSGVSAPDEVLSGIESFLQESAYKLTRADRLLNSVSVNSLPDDKQSLFIEARDSLRKITAVMDSFNKAFQVAAAMITGDKTILFGFANNNELRPGGGFLGTIGIAHTNRGKIEQLDIRTVYDYDGQLKELITVPRPMRAVNERWYMRDSNWFASHALNAERMMSMIQKETGPAADVVITMTPDVVIDALKRTGPIQVPQHNVTLDDKNFIELVQTATSLNYDKFLNQPKQVLADFVPLLLQRINDQDDSIPYFMALLFDHLQKKNIQVYAKDKTLQKQLEEFNWSGSILATKKDSLMVVSANLGGTKTDRALIKSVDLKSTVSTDGAIKNELTYIVKNPLPAAEGLENKSFVRFLIPKGSKINEVTGFDSLELPVESDIRFNNDPEVARWNNGLKYDNEKQVYLGSESGKDMIGGWMFVIPGETSTVKITYTLPFRLEATDSHSILVQKQPGSNLLLNYEVSHFGRKLLWKNTAEGVDQDDNFKYTSAIDRDMFIGMVMQRNDD